MRRFLLKRRVRRLREWQNEFLSLDFSSDFPYSPVLVQELKTARRALSAAYGEFNQATEPILIESCIYRIRAETARYDYLIRAVKASGNIPVRTSENIGNMKNINSKNIQTAVEISAALAKNSEKTRETMPEKSGENNPEITREQEKAPENMPEPEINLDAEAVAAIALNPIDGNSDAKSS